MQQQRWLTAMPQLGQARNLHSCVWPGEHQCRSSSRRPQWVTTVRRDNKQISTICLDSGTCGLALKNTANSKHSIYFRDVNIIYLSVSVYLQEADFYFHSLQSVFLQS